LRVNSFGSDPRHEYRQTQKDWISVADEGLPDFREHGFHTGNLVKVRRESGVEIVARYHGYGEFGNASNDALFEVFEDVTHWRPNIMGTLYYAVNTDTKRAYELGKGAWFLLVSDRSNWPWIADVSDYEKVLATVGRDIIGGGGWTDNAVADVAYHAEIAKELVSIGPKVEIRDDSRWDDPTGGCVIIGTRYRNVRSDDEL